jgi:hypothetical protein
VISAAFEGIKAAEAEEEIDFTNDVNTEEVEASL